jgi:PAS domain S-box-containing protein
VLASQPWEDTFPLRASKGEYRWFLGRAVPILGTQGEVVRWFGTATDVSSQIAAEEKILLLNRQLEQRVSELETIMQVLPAGIAISTDPAFARVTTNPGFRSIFESLTLPSPDGRLNSSSSKHDRTPFSIMSEAMRAGRPVVDAEMQLARPDGTEKHVLASASPLLELSGAVRGSVGVFFDVSHRKSLEHTSRERAELLELASEAIMVRDIEGTLRYWNAGAEALYGLRPEDAVNQNIHALLQTVFPVSREEIDRALITGGSWRGNLTQRTRDGREVVVASRMALDPETNGVLEINRDITGELRAEEALRQTEKLAAMGRMAGIIAHEINNPLEAITNAFYLLRRHPSLDDEARHYAELAEQELQRASHITRQTLSFYRESKQPIPVALPEVIESVLELQQRAIQTGGITIQNRYRTDGLVYGYPVELRQVLLNLVGNAIQAMPDGGVLRIHLAETVDQAAARRGVSISVLDTGVGIRPEDAEKLFQPFFSTKSTKGTGLGLWISKGIVLKYEGRITFRSLCYQGRHVTCFRVFLPSDAASASPRVASLETDRATPVATSAP